MGILLRIQPFLVDAVVMNPGAADSQKDDDDDGRDDPEQDGVLLVQDEQRVAQG